MGKRDETEDKKNEEIEHSITSELFGSKRVNQKISQNSQKAGSHGQTLNPGQVSIADILLILELGIPEKMQRGRASQPIALIATFHPFR